MTLKDVANHPQMRKARKSYSQAQAEKWYQVAIGIPGDGHPRELERFAYAMKRYRDFEAAAKEET